MKATLCCLFWRMKNRANLAGGSALYVRWEGKGGVGMFDCHLLMCPHRTGDSLLIFRAKTSPALEGGRRNRVLVFRDLTPYSLVFPDVSKESNAFISMG
jgi:hypothetical protein